MNKISNLVENQKLFTWFFFLALVPYGILCFFNNPSYDDFTYSVTALERNFCETQVYWYKSWSGRYTATALLTTINPLVYHWIYGYKLLSLAIVFGLFFSIHFLVATFFNQLNRLERLLFTSFFTAFYFSLLTQLSGGIYWMAGSITHAIPTILIGISIALIKRRGRRHLINYIVLPLMTFLIVGSNETIMCIWMILLLLLNIYVYKKNKKIDPVLLLLFVVGMVGSAIVVLAPGNAIRGSKFAAKAHRPLNAFINSTYYSFVYVIKLLSIPLSLFLIWVAKNANKIQESFRWYWINKQSLQLTLLIFFVIMFCTFLPAQWSMARRPPSHVYHMTIFFYLPLTILTVLQLAIIYPEKLKKLRQLKMNSKLTTCIFFTLFLLLGNNGRAIYDMIWEAPHYNAQLKSRYEKIAKSVGQDVVVEELTFKPKSIFYSDIGSDPSDFKNQMYAKYFCLRSISKKTEK